MNHLLAACLFILIILSAFTSAAYSSEYTYLDACIDEIELQYEDDKLKEVLVKECIEESEKVDSVKITQGLETN